MRHGHRAGSVSSARRARARGRAGGPFDDASEPPDEPFLATDLSASKAGSEVKAEGVRRGRARRRRRLRGGRRRRRFRRLPPQRSRLCAPPSAGRSAARRRRRAARAGKGRREGRRREPRAFPRVFVVFLVRVRVGERAGIGGGGAGEPLGGVGRGPGATRGGAARRGGGGDAGAAVRADVAAAGEQARDHVPARARAGRRGRGGRALAEAEGELAEAAAYMSKTREVRRILKREKRDADQRLALERAAAAAAASSRVGAQRRDADGNVIAPAHGADGLPEDAAAAAAAAAAQNAGFGRALGVGPGGSPKTAAAAAAAAAAPRRGVYHGRSPSGRPRIPKHVQDRFAGGVRIGSANALRLGLPAGDAGGVPARRGTRPARFPASGPPAAHIARRISSARHPAPAGSSPGSRRRRPRRRRPNPPPAAAPFSPSRFGPPEVLVDTIHAAAAHAEPQKSGGRGGASLGAKATEKLKLADALLECAVCAGTAEASKCQETLRCSRCALPAHPRCYGVKSVAAALAACAGREGKEKEGKTPNPKGWLCWVCRDACDRGKANTPAVAAAAATTPAGAPRPSLEEKLAMFRGVSCVLCPVQLGAFKQCADGRWCHVVCAQWMPEISVDEADVCRAIRGVQQIPKERARHPCVACGRAGGVSMRCSFGHCQVSFHPLRARAARASTCAPARLQNQLPRVLRQALAGDGGARPRARRRRAGDADAARNRGGAGGFPVGFPSRAPTSLVSAGADGSRRGDERDGRGSADPNHADHAGLPGAPLGSIGGPAPRALRASALTAESTASLEATAGAAPRASRAHQRFGAVPRRAEARDGEARGRARRRGCRARALRWRADHRNKCLCRARTLFRTFERPHRARADAEPGPERRDVARAGGVAPVAPKRARSRATRQAPDPQTRPRWRRREGRRAGPREARAPQRERGLGAARRRDGGRLVARVVVSVGCARVDFFYRFGFDRHLSSSSSATSTGAPRPPHVICSAFTVRDLDNADARDVLGTRGSFSRLLFPASPPSRGLGGAMSSLAFAAAAPSHARGSARANRVARGNPRRW